MHHTHPVGRADKRRGAVSGCVDRAAELTEKRHKSCASKKRISNEVEMERKRVAAVVVTYNRLPLLQKCVESLCDQTVSCDILVVNNHSTDGTMDWLEAQQEAGRLMVRDTGANIGGAGGFNYGMRWAVEAGYDYLWVMDDDCLPESSALAAFLEADSKLHGQYGFLSSKVLWKDGTLCMMNLQRDTLTHTINSFPNQLQPIVMASFVSLFIPRGIVLEMGLPIKEFFIWTDDWEYTRRISKKYPCFVVSDSVVVHHSANNIGANIVTEKEERLDRFEYLYRNDVYLYRREGFKGFAYEAVRLSGHCLRVLVRSRDHKWKRIKKIISGTWKGLSFQPKVEYV